MISFLVENSTHDTGNGSAHFAEVVPVYSIEMGKEKLELIVGDALDSTTVTD